MNYPLKTCMFRISYEPVLAKVNSLSLLKFFISPEVLVLDARHSNMGETIGHFVLGQKHEKVPKNSRIEHLDTYVYQTWVPESEQHRFERFEPEISLHLVINPKARRWLYSPIKSFVGATCSLKFQIGIRFSSVEAPNHVVLM